MPKGPYGLKGVVDPIGPGTSAWNSFDKYVEALRANEPKGNRTRTPADMGKDYMIRCLRKAGRADLIASWIEAAKQRAREDD